ncbi:winged helix-turn-helix transcriptional regulator [Dendrosporobacter sp. 1207_IL3150]|uniref:winged helix-turn-helix transcriptional regulator n=1 Tax=Dendrosporobacter sp. 1207_IL3150 TaxID=3084054 RepID=UPI002FD93D14
MAKWSNDECNCAITYTLSIVGGKWKWLILYKLSESGVLRYGELKKVLPDITHKMLSQQLKELEAEQLIHREEYHQIPPKVEYWVTPKGKTLLPILNQMSQWGEKNRHANNKNASEMAR